ncbi:hypothetical protein BDF19DRAFT_419126 [Syncephalis fuscata]|nr:hypothetical protein BDF19DRAFT_419126 [Syncephalis fuscata]
MHHSNVVLGKSTDDWLDFLMKYLLVLSHRGKWDHAHQVLRRIQQTSVFVIQDSWRVTSKLVEIVINLRQGEVEEAMHNARNLCRHIGVTHESLLFYNAIAPRYIDPIIAYGSSNAQKYVRRFILAMEAQAFQLSTSTTNTDSTDLLALLKPELFMLNASMSMVGKSYRLAIAYFTRAYRLSPFDPIVSLQLGISHLHRAMQRKTENRHAHILRGFAFFANYAQLRGHTQETAYNLGRAFQHIGLNFLAIPQYERAIRLSLSITNPINDLQRDAAYNLSLIYMSTGSPGLAQHLLYRYCTI